MPTKNVLQLNSDEALQFFMSSVQYHGFELPEYFDFDKVLAYVKESIGNRPYEDCLSEVLPDELENVNLDILLNKDGRYAVRPLMLANPFLYYFLTREICCPSGWEAILRCFESYTVPHLTSCALPVIPEKVEPFYKSATILNWWNTMEQRSLELSLEYRYMFVTDITNCYGSINPQSILWALTCKGTEHENDKNTQLAKNIQTYLRALQKGHNIGIPQGSALFDFVAEMVLGYSDLLLHEELQGKKISGYEIIRYRDDYRVFCDDKDTLETISYTLQSVLEQLNFRMNSQKTKISDSIVTDSIKPDKLFYIYNTPIFNKKGVDFDGIQKHLLYILMFSRKYPDSGQVKTMLSDLDKRIIEKLKPKKVTPREHSSKATKLTLDKLNTDSDVLIDGGETPDIDISEEELAEVDFTGAVRLLPEEDADSKQKKEIEVPGRLCENIRAMTAVATQIAVENVNCAHYALRIISRMVDSMKDMEEKQDIIDKVYAKLCRQHNNDYNQLWLQNMTYTQDKQSGSSPYTMRLCKLVMGENDQPIWNNDWLKPSFVENMPYDTVVNEDTLKNVTPVIVFREQRAYLDAFDGMEDFLEEMSEIAENQ